MATPSSSDESAASNTSNVPSRSAAAAPVSPPPPPPPVRPVHDSEEEAERLCNKWVESGLTKNPAIQFLIGQLESMGCSPPEGTFVQCLQCDVPGAGFFGRVVEEPTTSPRKRSIFSSSSGPSPPCDAGSSSTTLQEMLQREAAGQSKLSIVPEIYVCQQYMRNELHAHKTLVHELIHAVDQCRTQLDPLHNCLHVACTEVRAENLSGECSFWTELPRMIQGSGSSDGTTGGRGGKFAGHGRECVRRRAILSVRGNPHCSANADRYVDAVLERCFADVFPFDRHPNQR
jgi:inner membrane protease ATP23